LLLISEKGGGKKIGDFAPEMDGKKKGKGGRERNYIIRSVQLARDNVSLLPLLFRGDKSKKRGREESFSGGREGRGGTVFVYGQVEEGVRGRSGELICHKRGGGKGGGKKKRERAALCLSCVKSKKKKKKKRNVGLFSFGVSNNCGKDSRVRRSSWPCN